jgi:hypothetical protein
MVMQLIMPPPANRVLFAGKTGVSLGFLLYKFIRVAIFTADNLVAFRNPRATGSQVEIVKKGRET